jgi:uncharacterized membrane protein
MQTCPHCHTRIRISELPHQGFFKSFRICPDCGGSFIVDRKTRQRQAVFIVVALISLILTVKLTHGGSEWLLPALISYVIMGMLIYWGNRQVVFVPYDKDRNASDDDRR